MNETMQLLLSRRSVKAAEQGEPGPTAAELDLILQAAMRVPDHGKLGPWRFVRFCGDARADFGEVLARAWQAANPGDSPERAHVERLRLTRSPVVIAVISSVTPDHKIPEWEQVLSAGAVCQNLLVAAHAMGFRGQWLTEWYSFDANVAAALHLGPHERIAGWLYLGSAEAAPPERPRPALADRLSDWTRSEA